MKKAKVMLMVIAVLATVGTALAFKVQKVGNTKYFYSFTTIPPPPIECTLTADASKMVPTGQVSIYYTTTTNLANPGQLDCPFFARTILP